MAEPGARMLLSIDRMDVGPEELAPQLPALARLLRTLPGPDRPDYALLGLQRPLRMRTSTAYLDEVGVDLSAADPASFSVRADGSVDGRVYGLVVAPRAVGDTLGPASADLAVATAYVIDTSQMRDPAVDFSKIFYAAVTHVTVLR